MMAKANTLPIKRTSAGDAAVSGQLGGFGAGLLAVGEETVQPEGVRLWLKQAPGGKPPAAGGAKE